MNSEKVSQTGLRERIGFAIKKIGGQKAASLALGISTRSISSYMTGDAEPKLLISQRLAELADVSLDWLATGEGMPEKDNLDEMVKDIKVDADLMAEIVKVVNEYLDSLDRELPPEKLGKIYAYLYNYCHKDESVRRDNIISLIDIAG